MDAHVVFAGTRIASVRAPNAGAGAGGGERTLYYYRTRLGSVVATSLGGGAPGASYRYSPYGETEIAVNESADTASELGYTNALRLSGGLLYLKTRVYDTQARVFIQPDSVDRLRYAYVTGDPINYSDPTGLLPRADELIPDESYEAASSEFHAIADAVTRSVSDQDGSETPVPADESEQARATDEIALQTEANSARDARRQRMDRALKEAQEFGPIRESLAKYGNRIEWNSEGLPDDPNNWRFGKTEPVNGDQNGQPVRKHVIPIDFEEIDAFNAENRRRGANYQMTDAEAVVHEVSHVRLYERKDYGQRKTQSQKELPAYMAQDAYRRSRGLDPLPSVMYDRYIRNP